MTETKLSRQKRNGHVDAKKKVTDTGSNKYSRETGGERQPGRLRGEEEKSKKVK